MIKLKYTKSFGRHRLFPVSNELDELFKWFPSVHGNRHCLSLQQVKALEGLGIKFEVLPTEGKVYVK
jgi:hypothetical protein